ncbi:hypothetical protein BGY98DRAFT_1076880 [Russula aff. rugulosa BPL654]|nr:hypothetical protein BGY98DRAFT_1076880 [Russula aff. rugulosa BPL654]
MGSGKKRSADEADVATREDGAKRRENTASGKDVKGGLKTGAIPASDFKARAVPLHVVVTRTPPAARDDDSASSAPVDDTDLLGAVALQPCSFTTGSYGWKGSKRLAIDLVDPTGGEKKKVQVMLTINATVIGSKQAEKEAEVEVDPDTNDADGGAIAPAERVS